MPPPSRRVPRDTRHPVKLIEQVFAKLKRLLRKAAERTLNSFPPHECAAYLRNSGYASI